MPIQLPTPNPRAQSGDWNGPMLLAAVVAGVGTAAAGALVWTLPPPLVLPAVATLAIVAATLVAAIAWVTAQRASTPLTYWDVAGALTFVGVFAALLSDPELALPLLETQRTE